MLAFGAPEDEQIIAKFIAEFPDQGLAHARKSASRGLQGKYSIHAHPVLDGRETPELR
jgi:hypothetical protein